MSRRLIRSSVAAAVVVALVLGIWWASAIAAERKAMAAIVAYDTALAEATSVLDTGPLTEAADSAQIARVNAYLQFLFGMGKRLDSRLRAVDIESIERAEDATVLVVAREEWAYVEYWLESGEALGPEQVVTQEVHYTLTKGVDGRLVVLRADLVEAGEPE